MCNNLHEHREETEKVTMCAEKPSAPFLFIIYHKIRFFVTFFKKFGKISSGEFMKKISESFLIAAVVETAVLVSALTIHAVSVFIMAAGFAPVVYFVFSWVKTFRQNASIYKERISQLLRE
jgi:hypothetical protein